MDPFSDSGELFNIQRSYYTGDYNQVLVTDTSKFSDSNKLQAQVLVNRAKVALGRASDVVTDLASATEPELQIVHAYAEYVNGAKEVALKKAEELIQKHGGDNSQVQFIGGIILVLENRQEDALKLALRHQGSLECISLVVQIYIEQNKLEKAQKEIDSAKKWAQDNIVFNLAESWVELRKGGVSECQSAFYIYEELTAGMGQTAKALNGKAVSTYCQPTRTDNLDKNEREELNNQRESGLKEALDLEPENPDLLANSVTGAIIQGKDYTDFESKLEQVNKDHASLVDMQSKRNLFDKVLEKYSTQLAAAK